MQYLSHCMVKSISMLYNHLLSLLHFCIASNNSEDTAPISTCNAKCHVKFHLLYALTDLQDKYNGLGFTMERPCAAPCPFLCWPFNCTIINPLKIFVRSTDGMSPTICSIDGMLLTALSPLSTALCASPMVCDPGNACVQSVTL